MFVRLGVANRTQATVRARDLDLLADAAAPPAATRLSFPGAPLGTRKCGRSAG